MVLVAVSCVVTPTRPTRTPRRCRITEARTLGQATGEASGSARRLAARAGKGAAAIQALSAPRGSWLAVASRPGPTGP